MVGRLTEVPLKPGVWAMGQAPVGSEFKSDSSTRSSVTLGCGVLCLSFFICQIGVMTCLAIRVEKADVPPRAWSTPRYT